MAEDLRWVGTPAEGVLRRIRLRPRRKGKRRAYPLTNRGQEEFSNAIYGSIRRIAKDAGAPWTPDPATLKRVERVFGPPARPTPKLSLARQAAIYRQAAAHLAKASAAIKMMNPAAADILANTARQWIHEAVDLTEHAEGPKHPQQSETRRILELMDLIYHETGKYHDRELSQLLELRGLHQYTPGYLRSLRSKSRHNTSS